MKLHVMSDLHFEMRNWKQFTQQVLPGGETLVLAGDILYLSSDKAVEQMKAICEKYENVLYVPGNHEFYDSDTNDAEGLMQRLAIPIPNLTFVTPYRRIKIKDKWFIGGTMWFPEDPMNPMFENRLNDFHWIKNFKPWVYVQNKSHVEALTAKMKEGDVVVTHHLPTPLSIPEHYKTDSMNRFYLCDMSSLIVERKPSLWIHGHTHHPCDYIAGNTRVYANPLGYPGEKSNPSWKNRVEIDV